MLCGVRYWDVKVKNLERAKSLKGLDNLLDFSASDNVQCGRMGCTIMPKNWSDHFHWIDFSVTSIWI